MNHKRIHPAKAREPDDHDPIAETFCKIPGHGVYCQAESIGKKIKWRCAMSATTPKTKRAAKRPAKDSAKPVAKRTRPHRSPTPPLARPRDDMEIELVR